MGAVVVGLGASTGPSTLEMEVGAASRSGGGGGGGGGVGFAVRLARRRRGSEDMVEVRCVFWSLCHVMSEGVSGSASPSGNGGD